MGVRRSNGWTSAFAFVLFVALVRSWAGCGTAETAKPEPIQALAAPRERPPTLALPVATPRTYQVQPNDGWWKIAHDNGVEMDSLLRANDATTDTLLVAGQSVQLPDSARAAAPPKRLPAPRTHVDVDSTPQRAMPEVAAREPVARQPQTSAATGYGAISGVTGLPRTTYVSGYTRKNGTYVAPYHRSHR